MVTGVRLEGTSDLAAPWQEQLVGMGLGIGAICILVACCFVIYGLRRTGESEPGATPPPRP
jgi:hypothetical protein